MISSCLSRRVERVKSAGKLTLKVRAETRSLCGLEVWWYSAVDYVCLVCSGHTQRFFTGRSPDRCQSEQHGITADCGLLKLAVQIFRAWASFQT